MSADVFISYAWTSHQHREWVRLLAVHLKAIGFDVLVDADVDYGDPLTGFMQRATDCRHVLLIVDPMYVDRADNLPDSGVGVETKAISEAYDSKARGWLLVVAKDNPTFALPNWLMSKRPKGIQFTSDPATGAGPGSEQIEDLWRWLEDLPANRDHAVSAATARARARRVEEIDRMRDPNAWSAPSLTGEVLFEYSRSPGSRFTLGHSEFKFVFEVSNGGPGIFVYSDPIKAVGLNRTGSGEPNELTDQLTPGRTIAAFVGDQVILLNEHGMLCLINILDVDQGRTEPTFVEPSVRFGWKVLTGV